MKIQLSEDALQWFQEEMDVAPGEYVQFFARYGGSSALHEGFSLGVQKQQEPDEVAAETVHDGVTYYVEARDEWYFQDHDLIVTVNDDLEELHFSYE
ncbi:hypothetical protein GOP80_07325 [Planococcaceae bacterium Storch 2/2-2]|nr:hypothetical protein [Planococcaceae bacterium Storch 2/2-2]